MSRRPAQPVCPKGRLLGHALAFPARGRTRSTAASAGASPLREWTRVHHGGHTSSESGAPAPPARYTQRTSAPALLLLDERRFVPPRPVEVEHDGLVAGDPAGLEAVRGRPRMAGRRRVRRRVPRLMPDRVGLPDSADAGAVVPLRTGELVGRHRRPGRRGGVLAPAASPPVPHPRRTLRPSLEEGLAPAGQRLSHTLRGAAKRDPLAAAACGAPIRTEV
jgi:hypothetical protein